MAAYVTDLPDQEAKPLAGRGPLSRPRRRRERLRQTKKPVGLPRLLRAQTRGQQPRCIPWCSFTISGTCSPDSRNRADIWKRPERAAGSSRSPSNWSKAVVNSLSGSAPNALGGSISAKAKPASPFGSPQLRRSCLSGRLLQSKNRKSPLRNQLQLRNPGSIKQPILIML